MIKGILKFLGYVSLKWLCFYTYLLLNSKSKWNWNQVQTKEDIFYTVWMLLALPIAEIAILLFPFQLALRFRGLWLLVILVFIFILEFTIGWYATNRHLELWMIIKITLSIVLFLLVYEYRKMLGMLPK